MISHVKSSIDYKHPTFNRKRSGNRHRHRPNNPIFLINQIYKRLVMPGQSRKWMILVATIWIQAFTGTNFDFSAYSSEIKKVLGISQVQLNYLAVASDMGKVFGWSSGLALMYFPLWLVLFMAAFMGLVGYGIQWLVIIKAISLPYMLVCSAPFTSYLFFFFFPIHSMNISCKLNQFLISGSVFSWFAKLFLFTEN